MYNYYNENVHGISVIVAKHVIALILVYYLLPDTRTTSDHNKIIIFVQVSSSYTFVLLITLHVFGIHFKDVHY